MGEQIEDVDAVGEGGDAEIGAAPVAEAFQIGEVVAALDLEENGVARDAVDDGLVGRELEGGDAERREHHPNGGTDRVDDLANRKRGFAGEEIFGPALGEINPGLPEKAFLLKTAEFVLDVAEGGLHLGRRPAHRRRGVGKAVRPGKGRRLAGGAREGRKLVGRDARHGGDRRLAGGRGCAAGEAETKSAQKRTERIRRILRGSVGHPKPGESTGKG